MPIHPNLYRNGRDPKKEAIELARLHSGYAIIPKENKVSRFDNSFKVSQRSLIYTSLKLLARTKELPKEDRDFWKEVLIELKQIPDPDINEDPPKPNQQENTRSKKRFSKWVRGSLIILGIFLLFFGQRIVYGLTPVDSLTKILHENSKYTFSGSICNDGHVSHSQGRGSCSWHNGVNYEFNKGDYKKSWEECKQEAIKLSWRYYEEGY
jgi:hypothetical protein